MVTQSARMRTFATNSLFGTFFLSAFGWGLLQSWAALVGASGFMHALIAMPCISMTGIVLYRYSRHWPSTQLVGNAQRESDPQLFAYRAMIWCLMLAVSGVGISVAVSWGSIALVMLGAVGLVAIPWARIPVCRDRFFVAAAALGVGAVIGWSLFGRPLHPLYFPVAGAAILLTSCVTVLFILMTHGNKFDRMPESGY